MALLIGQTDWFSSKSRLIWRMKVTKYKRSYFQLAALKPHTEGIGFGLLPTPVVSSAPYQYSNGDKSRPVTLTLTGLAKAGLLPTPTAREYKGGRHPETLKRKGRNPTNSLGDLVEFNYWREFPTQSPVLGRDDGLPHRMDRVRGLGNAVVPALVLAFCKTIDKHYDTHLHR
jgi:hypothetical protein